MTRKDYILIAQAIHEGFQVAATGLPSGVNQTPTILATIHHDVVCALANALVSTNPRFNQERFRSACLPAPEKPNKPPRGTPQA